MALGAWGEVSVLQLTLGHFVFVRPWPVNANRKAALESTGGPGDVTLRPCEGLPDNDHWRVSFRRAFCVRALREPLDVNDAVRWKDQPHRRPFSRLTFYFELAAMGLHDGLGDRQTQSSSLIVAGKSALDLPKRR